MNWHKGALKSTFANAAQSRPGQFLIRHAGKLGSAAFVLGDLSLMTKHYFHRGGRPPNRAEQLSGGIFLLTDGLLAMMDKYPAMKIPAGISILLGATALGYSGIGEPSQNQMLFGSAVLGGMGLALMFEDRKSTRLNSSHIPLSRMPSSA